MTGIQFRMHRVFRLPAALLVAALLSPASAALAQERSNGNFLDNLFNRGEQPAQSVPEQSPRGQGASSDPGDLAVRLDRMENALRQLTGTIEQLQYRNQQLEMRLQRMQEGGQAPARAMPQAVPPPAAQPGPGRRSDVFDPSQNPTAPGVPRTLGSGAVIAAPEPNDLPVGAPGGRAAGAPLDLTTLAANPPGVSSVPPAPSAGPVIAAPMPAMPNNAQLPPPPARNVGAPNTQLATLPPSAKPQDEYDLAYGYVLHKDYALAEQAFRSFLRKYPDERLVPDAQYWLGESLFQRQRYRDAAESFLAVSTKFEKSGKAPDALLRLGQSLAAMNQKEAACATLAEVGRKYPKASAGVKRGAAQEIKRARC